jgi:hypothetical protein
MGNIRNIAASLPFAHLLGMHAKVEDEDRKQKEDESDDDYAKRMKKMDDDDEDARKAEEEDKKKEDARKAEDDKKKDEEAKAKRAKEKSEDDDDDEMKDEEEDEEEGKRAGRAKSARRRERERCAAIFNCPVAATHPHVAANLAFNTNMSRSAAIAVLQTVGASSPGRGSFAGRMAAAPQQPIATQATDATARPLTAGMSKVAAMIVSAGEKARGR